MRKSVNAVSSRIHLQAVVNLKDIGLGSSWKMPKAILQISRIPNPLRARGAVLSKTTECADSKQLLLHKGIPGCFGATDWNKGCVP
jgi:hypothetical protein